MIFHYSEGMLREQPGMQEPTPPPHRDTYGFYIEQYDADMYNYASNMENYNAMTAAPKSYQTEGFSPEMENKDLVEGRDFEFIDGVAHILEFPFDAYQGYRKEEREPHTIENIIKGIVKKCMVDEKTAKAVIDAIEEMKNEGAGAPNYMRSLTYASLEAIKLINEIVSSYDQPEDVDIVKIREITKATLLKSIDSWTPIIENKHPQNTWLLLGNEYWVGVGMNKTTYNEDEPQWIDETSEYINKPTHWMHLPPKPFLKSNIGG